MNGGIFSAGQWRGRLVAGLLLWAAPGRADNFSFSTNADNTITLTAYNGEGGNVIVPSRVNELPVVEIGPSAFMGCRTVTDIDLPGSMLRIGRNAFMACTNLPGMFIPAAVNSIGDGAFSWCSRMTAIDVDTNNANFESRNGVLFNEDGSVLICHPGGMAGSYVVPDGVVELAPSAFVDCDEMPGIGIPNGILCIGKFAFSGCDGLTNVLLPQSVTNVADGAFASCAQLASISVDSDNPAYEAADGALLAKGGGEFVQCPGSRVGTYAVPATVTNIRASAFAGCEGLTNIWIPPSVIAMGADPFASCYNLAAFEVDPSNPMYASMEGVLYFKDIHVLVRYPPGKSGPCVLPDSVADVADSAFSCCTELSHVSLGNAVTNIGASAFVNCQNLNTVTLGSGVARIGAFAFVACPNLRELYIAGNAPSFDGSIYGTLTTTTVYRLSESTGWDAPSWYGYMMSHSALWVPRISDDGLGLQSGRFGFQMNWAAGHAVVVEACTNLAAPVWLALETNELADGAGIFEDEEETTARGRFYRVVPAP